MLNDIAIRVQNVEKGFKIYRDKGGSRRFARLGLHGRRELKQVLRGVSFEVRRGEAIGLVGENGCGKSTMLKLLSRIMYPDAGEVTVKGRVSSLIELGAGFHPDMSGRENIFTNAAIFGLKRHEIEARMHDIIAFCELGEYIDNPVRTYSSGMYMRLAFSVAINVSAEVLLVDEILAVGDASFQAKCFNKLREIKASGTTIVIVSHSLSQIEQFCDRSIWIKDGKLEMEGAPADVHPAYLQYMGKKGAKLNGVTGGTEGMRWGSKAVEIEKAVIGEGENEAIRTGADMDLTISYKRNDASVCMMVAGFGIFRSDGLQIYGTNTKIERLPQVCVKDRGEIRLHFAGVNLLPGEYTLDVAIHDEDEMPYDYWRGCKRFTVMSELEDRGVSRQFHAWEYERAEKGGERHANES